MKNRNSIINLFICFGVMFSLASCRTAGLYTSNPKDKMAFAGNEVELTSSDSFYLRSWTDNYTNYVDSEGNRVFKENRHRGYGTYECLGDSLQLTFSNEDSITIVLDLEWNESKVDLTFQTFDELDKVFYPNADILDSDGHKIDGTLFQMKDTFRFEILKNKNPELIRLVGFGVNIENPNINISELDSGRYIYKRKSYNGYFAKETVKTIWFKRVPTGIRYQMRNRKRYLPKKWKWNWINKLYRDY